MNIAERMTQLLSELKSFKNKRLRLSPECSDVWGPNYAIVQGYYFDIPCSDDEYVEFDSDRFMKDFEQFVAKTYFPGCVIQKNYGQKHPSGTVVLNFRRPSQEIEVYREANPVIF